jgi:hypothetical protein
MLAQVQPSMMHGSMVHASPSCIGHVETVFFPTKGEVLLEKFSLSNKIIILQ